MGVFISRHKAVIFYLSLFIALVLIFLPSLNSLPFGDDYIYIFDNTDLKNASSAFVFWDLNNESFKSWPITYSLIWFIYQFLGEEFWAYRLLNLSIHLLNIILFHRLSPSLSIKRSWIPTLLFAFHPMVHQSIFWIFQIKTLLSTSFVLLAVLLLKSRPRLSALSLFISLFTKSSAFLFFIPFFQKVKRSKKVFFLIPMALVFFVIFARSLGSKLPDLFFNIPSQKSISSFPIFLLEKLDFIFDTLAFFFLRLFGFFSNFVITYKFWNNISDFLFLCSAIFISYIIIVNRRNQFMHFFLLALIPVLGIFYIPYHYLVPFSDHWFYLPLPFFLLSLGRFYDRNAVLIFIPLFIGLSVSKSIQLIDIEENLEDLFQNDQSQVLGEYLFEVKKRKGKYAEALDVIYASYPQSNRKELTLSAIWQLANLTKSKKAFSFYYYQKSLLAIKKTQLKQAQEYFKKVEPFYCDEKCELVRDFLSTPK